MSDDGRDQRVRNRGQKRGDAKLGSGSTVVTGNVVSGRVESTRQFDSGKKGAKDVTTSGPFTLKDIASILEMLDKHDVTEFRLQRGEERLALRRGKEPKRRAPQAVPQLVTALQQAPQQQGNPASNVVPFHAAADQNQRPQTTGKDGAPAPAMAMQVAEVAPKRALKEVTSPMVGTFYRRPAVDAEPYVDVGDSVKKGDVVCIVEAMKLMNEIETDTSGKIVEVCLEDGQMVEFGEVLFRIELI